MKRLLLITSIFIAGCNTQQSEQKEKLYKDTIIPSNTVSIPITANTNLKPLTDKNEIIGIWTSENKEPLTVKISKDSIYYTEHFESHKYILRKDSIFINYPDFIYAAKVYFSNDSLIMESENGKSFFVKFKG
jgi:hypothetical protein